MNCAGLNRKHRFLRATFRSGSRRSNGLGPRVLKPCGPIRESLPKLRHAAGPAEGGVPFLRPRAGRKAQEPLDPDRELLLYRTRKTWALYRLGAGVLT